MGHPLDDDRWYKGTLGNFSAVESSGVEGNTSIEQELDAWADAWIHKIPFIWPEDWCEDWYTHKMLAPGRMFRQISELCSPKIQPEGESPDYSLWLERALRESKLAEDLLIVKYEDTLCLAAEERAMSVKETKRKPEPNLSLRMVLEPTDSADTETIVDRLETLWFVAWNYCSDSYGAHEVVVSDGLVRVRCHTQLRAGPTPQLPEIEAGLYTFVGELVSAQHSS